MSFCGLFEELAQKPSSDGHGLWLVPCSDSYELSA